MFWDGFPGQIIVNKRNLGPECQKVTPTEVKVDGPARAHPGVTRALRSRMTYPHTPKGTGKRLGTIEERLARLHFRPNT